METISSTSTSFYAFKNRACVAETTIQWLDDEGINLFLIAKLIKIRVIGIYGQYLPPNAAINKEQQQLGTEIGA